MTPEGAAARYETVLGQAARPRRERGAGPHRDPGVLAADLLGAQPDAAAGPRRDRRACGSAILFNDVDEERGRRYYNAARLLTPEGLARPAVPQGPPRAVRRVRAAAAGSSSSCGRSRSDDRGVLARRPGPGRCAAAPFAIGVGICYEIIYPSLARREVADGANLLATISNDSWYGRAGAQEQHFAGAVLRAVENGRYLVRAAITGISGIVDARGGSSRELADRRAGDPGRDRAPAGRDDGVDALGLLAFRRPPTSRRSPCYSSASSA